MAAHDHAGVGWPVGGMRFEPEVERAFMATLGADAWVRVRIVTLVALAGTVGYLLFAAPEHPEGYERFGPDLSIVVLLVQLAFTFTAPSARSLRWGAPLTWLTVGGFTVTAVLRTAQGHGTVPFDVLLVFVLAVYFGSGVGIDRAVTVAASISTAWIGFGVALDVPRPAFPYEVLLLVATNAVGAFGAFVLEVERRQAFELQLRLESVAFTDPLTGLPDRRGFDQRLDDLWAIAVEERRSVAPYALVDVDQFKSVNDAAGHAGGDRALQLVAEHLTAHLRRPLDVAGRIGGDEFALAWFDVDERWLLANLEDLCRSVATASGAATDLPACSVSVGAVLVARPEGTPGPARLAADQVLLQVKASGRGRAELVHG